MTIVEALPLPLSETDDGRLVGGGRRLIRCGLPLRPRPLKGEWAYGYWVRLAAANGYDGPRALWRAMAPSLTAPKAALRKMLHLSQVEWSRLYGPWPAYCHLQEPLPAGLQSQDFCHGVMRWCPYCLQEAAYLRYLWNIKLCCVCGVHGCYLCDTCPSCGQRQRIERAHLAQCACGYELTATPAISMDTKVQQVQHALYDAVRNGTNRYGYPKLSGAEWVKLFHFVATLEEPKSPRRTGQVADLNRLDRAIELSAKVAKLLAEWPTDFDRLLAELQASADRSFSLPRTFGRLYHWLYAELTTPGFGFLRESFEAYLREHWSGLVCRRNRRIGNGGGAACGRATIHDFAQTVGARPSRVKQLHLAGWIDASVVPLRGGRQAWSVPLAQVESVAEIIKDGMALKDAAMYLGLPRHRLRELIYTGILVPKVAAGQWGAAAWLLSRNELNLFAYRCADNAASAGTFLSEKTVPLRVVLKTWRLERRAFPALMQAIATGAIPGTGRIGDSMRLGDLLLFRAPLQHWIDQWRLEYAEDLSIDSAAKALGVKQEVAYQLVRSGRLASKDRSPGRAVKRVAVVAVHAFQAQYISLAELARARAQSPRAALKTISVAPAIGPSIDGCRQYFYCRSDF